MNITSIDEIIKNSIINKKDIVKTINTLLKEEKIYIFELINSSYYNIFIKSKKNEDDYLFMLKNFKTAELNFLVKDNFFKKFKDKELLLEKLNERTHLIGSADYILFSHPTEIKSQLVLKNHIKNKLRFVELEKKWNDNDYTEYYKLLKSKLEIDVDAVLKNFPSFNKIVEKYIAENNLKNF